MTKEELERIGKLKKELVYLNKQLDLIPTTSDSVKGSTKTFPYIERTIIITGLDRARFDQLVARIKRDMENKIDEIMIEVEKAQAYIETVDDADTRIILQSRYINGLTWDEIENDMGIPHSTAQRKLRLWGKSQ